ncbi:MAG: hypothetical protein ACQCXQ_07960, partial [Verrucomicrobiales bacterium]
PQRIDWLERALSATAEQLKESLDRPEDLRFRPLATGGFFGFWKKTGYGKRWQRLPRNWSARCR